MRRITVFAAATVLAASTVVALAGPASAQAEVAGEGVCRPDGSFLITWTVDNSTGYPMSIETVWIDGVATDVAFAPNPVPYPGSATGTMSVAGDVAGSLGIAVAVLLGADPQAPAVIEGSVDVPGDCPQPVATTPTNVVTPTQVVRAGTVARPAFTG